jgi:type IV fimbrial biogenesis protein FimT
MFENTKARHLAWGHGAGFTIIELMITVAVASILLAIAVPSFNQMIISGRLTAQSNEMVAAMSLARSEAIKRNANVTLCRSANMTGCVTSAGAWQNWIIRVGPAAAGTVLRQGSMNNFGGTLVMRSTLTNDQVIFGPDGLARTGGTTVADHTITVCSRREIDRNVRRIVLGAGSRMSTEAADATCTA